MTFATAMREAAQGIKSLLVGLKITGKTFTEPQVTVHYPRKEADNLGSYRGHIELVGSPKDPATPRCITCMLCQSVCPTGCISIKKHPKPPAPKEEPVPESGQGPMVSPEKAPPPKAKVIKTPKKFDLNYDTCSLCGLCVQNCPVNALRFSTHVYLAGFKREDFHYDLMERLKLQAERLGKDAAKVKAPANTDLPEDMPGNAFVAKPAAAPVAEEEETEGAS